MNSRLDRVQDWMEIAVKTGFRIEAVARELHVSTRSLHRYIRERFGKAPKRWIDELRVAHAASELEHSKSAKTAMVAARYAHESSFCRFFKRVTGATTRKHLAAAWMSERTKESPKKINNI